MLPTKYALAWLDTVQPICMEDFKPREFTSPVLTSGLSGAEGDSLYQVALNANGGRRPFTWELEQLATTGFVSAPTVAPTGDTR
jgi:hypothetical protein